MSKSKQLPHCSRNIYCKYQESSPQKIRDIQAVNSNLQLQIKLLSKRYEMQIQQKNKINSLLREQNIGLQNKIQQMVQIQYERKERVQKKKNIYMASPQSFDNLLANGEQLQLADSVQIFASVCQKLEKIFNKDIKEFSPIAKIAEDFVSILKNDPNENKMMNQAIKQIQANIIKLSQNYFQDQVYQNLVCFKESMKKQRENLKTALQQTINFNLKLIHQKQQKILEKQAELLSSLPLSIKELKEVSKKREEDHKRQISLLEEKIISISQENSETVDSQNKLISQLRQNLCLMKEIYSNEIQIPIVTIRETVQRQIQNIKLQFAKMYENTTLNSMISNLIESFKKYAQSKNISNNMEIHSQIKKIGEKLNLVNDYCLKTINKVRQIIKQNSFCRLDVNLSDRIYEKQLLLSAKKKQKEELQFQAKYYKQKEYIGMLQRFNKKLEQSIISKSTIFHNSQSRNIQVTKQIYIQ